MQEEQSNNFAIGGRREYLLGEKCTQHSSVDQIPIMGDSDGIVVATCRTDDEWAGILNTTRTGRGVAHMTDAAAREGQTRACIRKDLTYFAHADTMSNLPLAIIDR